MKQNIKDLDDEFFNNKTAELLAALKEKKKKLTGTMHTEQEMRKIFLDIFHNEPVTLDYLTEMIQEDYIFLPEMKTP